MADFLDGRQGTFHTPKGHAQFPTRRLPKTSSRSRHRAANGATPARIWSALARRSRARIPVSGANRIRQAIGPTNTSNDQLRRFQKESVSPKVVELTRELVSRRRNAVGIRIVHGDKRPRRREHNSPGDAYGSASKDGNFRFNGPAATGKGVAIFLR